MMPVQSPQRVKSHAQAASCRLFFALWPDDAVRRVVYTASRRTVELCGGSPIPPDNFHITLAFLGGFAAEQVDPVVAQAMVAAREVRGASFTFELDRLGHWPGSQVIWFGCRQVPEAVRILARTLRVSLRAHALEFDRRRFVPHLTIARWVKRAGGFEALAPIPWTVDEFVLIRSVSRPGGVDYAPLGRWPLAAAESLQTPGF